MDSVGTNTQKLSVSRAPSGTPPTTLPPLPDAIKDGVLFHVANVIPPQKTNLDFAPALMNTAGFAPVKAQTFESTVTDYPGVYIIGDASSVSLPTIPPTFLPKSANIAADQAKIVASVITRKIAGIPLETSLAMSAVQFNAIRSNTAKTAVYAHAGFQFNGTSWVASSAFPNAGNSSTATLPANISKDNYEDGLTWRDALLANIYE